MPPLDGPLKADRGAPGRRNTFDAPAGELPDGVMVTLDGLDAWLLWQGGLHRWTPGGYTERRATAVDPVGVITPGVTVAALRNGYRVEPPHGLT